MKLHVRFLRKRMDVLKRVSWMFYCLLLAATAVPVVIISRLVYHDVREFSAAGQRNGIGMMEKAPSTEWALPDKTSGKQAAVQLNPSQSPEDDGSRYFSDSHRRKAASFLARNSDLEGALSLLNVDKDVRNLSRSAGQQAIATLRADMPTLWTEQIKALRDYWYSLPDEKRLELYSPDRQASAETLTLLLNKPNASRNELIQVLPESLWFSMLCTIHAGLADGSPLPPAVIRLFLEPMSRDERLSNRLYWKASTIQKTPITEHVIHFSRAVHVYFLWPILKENARQNQQQLLAADKPMAEWLESIWGVHFCRELRQFNVESQNASLHFPWRSLIPQSQKLWSDRLNREFSTQMVMELSPAVHQATPWLHDGARNMDSQFILDRVRDYPGWQQALGVFDYEQAHNAALDALKQLYAGWYFVRTVGDKKVITLESLSSELNNEKKAFISRKFPWLELIAELGGVNEGVPTAIRAERGWKAMPKTTGTRWKDINPRKLLLVLRRLSEKKPKQKRRFEKLIEYYSVNRNLTLKKTND